MVSDVQKSKKDARKAAAAAKRQNKKDAKASKDEDVAGVSCRSLYDPRALLFLRSFPAQLGSPSSHPRPPALSGGSGLVSQAKHVNRARWHLTGPTSSHHLSGHALPLPAGLPGGCALLLSRVWLPVEDELPLNFSQDRQLIRPNKPSTLAQACKRPP